jgi:catechol 2,3-dioxygenase-like lactoylglutathione lyase family enzyme
MNGKITGSAGVLLVKDVVAAAQYYRDKLGFDYDRLWNDPPTFVIVRRDGHSLMLAQPDDPAKVVPHWTVMDKMWDVYFWVDNVDAIYTEMQERGATIDYSLYLTSYRVKEFGVQDLDGHDIAFGQIVS